MANEFKTTHVTKKCILFNNLSVHELSNNNVCIELHYKRVFHTFPSPKKTFKNSSCLRCKSLKKNSKTIVDLTESNSEDNSVNKTYTLFKPNDKLVRVENSTETNMLPVKVSCDLKTQNENNSTQTKQVPIQISHDMRTQGHNNSSQTDPIPTKIFNSCKTQTELDIKQLCIDSTNIDDTKKSTQIDLTFMPEKPITTEAKNINNIFNKFNDIDIFQAKVTIVNGYNFPMVKLIGDTTPTAPTTYVIMKDHSESILSTSTVVKKTNPEWNSVWTVVLPKTKLIEVYIYIYMFYNKLRF